jgi:hypothetical protein
MDLESKLGFRERMRHIAWHVDELKMEVLVMMYALWLQWQQRRLR